MTSTVDRVDQVGGTTARSAGTEALASQLQSGTWQFGSNGIVEVLAGETRARGAFTVDDGSLTFHARGTVRLDTDGSGVIVEMRGQIDLAAAPLTLQLRWSTAGSDHVVTDDRSGHDLSSTYRATLTLLDLSAQR
jgi:hypothetical protein